MPPTDNADMRLGRASARARCRAIRRRPRIPCRPPILAYCALREPGCGFRFAIRMKNLVHFSSDLRGFCLFSFVALSLLAGCGKKGADPQTPAAPVKPALRNDFLGRQQISSCRVQRVSLVRIRQSRQADEWNRSGTEYTDRTVAAGKTYSYYVTSVDFKGVESKPSGKITATVPTTVTPPAKQ